jgi:hypothetical protein
MEDEAALRADQHGGVGAQRQILAPCGAVSGGELACLNLIPSAVHRIVRSMTA